MPRAVAGILIECDESIKAMIVKIDRQHNHDFIIENIDDKHALIKADRHEELKELLKKDLKDTVREPEDSSESE
ncbi:TFIIH complex subunit tfb5 [Friedmanniomyces endolithicus]|uniref:General transcription and DNA repair factor IIH subunit TFB5 n=1 Tax=Friedmanniomyces endolithicus TaxID=329885 RepID=A0A4U0VKE9_9PEZI|nr:TFIIH complex subunit tfb5 [Friedmanniomyces endolithicus]KAK0287417.1 TFIIH complex subunit tfb5 [Friedmanniomyces endolithicus]KAK0300291.1 TFIIH complex subunit tfb5 [Friedmanniomyces endolithicus]KAK0314795.1 TFIIH complex subunit tfb5 [Friedmanniomyces endolithicus]KAK0324909.1 TFIIH complex subunit tfb5 [Friedmanniomyces endolithicus]